MPDDLGGSLHDEEEKQRDGVVPDLDDEPVPDKQVLVSGDQGDDLEDAEK